MNSILSRVVDNYAAVIDGEKEGSVREIFEQKGYSKPLIDKRLRDDREIQAHIEKIKAHPWVRVVEGQ